jgi:hypothetical protein
MHLGEGRQHVAQGGSVSAGLHAHHDVAGHKDINAGKRTRCHVHGNEGR